MPYLFIESSGLRYPETHVGGRETDVALMIAIGARRQKLFDAPYIVLEEPVIVLDKLERYGYHVVSHSVCHSCEIPGKYYYTWTLLKKP